MSDPLDLATEAIREAMDILRPITRQSIVDSPAHVDHLIQRAYDRLCLAEQRLAALAPATDP